MKESQPPPPRHKRPAVRNVTKSSGRRRNLRLRRKWEPLYVSCAQQRAFFSLSLFFRSCDTDQTRVDTCSWLEL